MGKLRRLTDKNIKKTLLTYCIFPTRRNKHLRMYFWPLCWSYWKFSSYVALKRERRWSRSYRRDKWGWRLSLAGSGGGGGWGVGGGERWTGTQAKGRVTLRRENAGSPVRTATTLAWEAGSEQGVGRSLSHPGVPAESTVQKAAPAKRFFSSLSCKGMRGDFWSRGWESLPSQAGSRCHRVANSRTCWCGVPVS